MGKIISPYKSPQGSWKGLFFYPSSKIFNNKKRGSFPSLFPSEYIIS
jgi:hypothetical protein